MDFDSSPGYKRRGWVGPTFEIPELGLSMDKERIDKAMRVTFVHAPNRFFSEVQNNGVLFMPVWAYTLAAHLPSHDGFHLRLLDTRFDDLDRAEDADVFLFSGINQDFDDLVEAHGSLKARFSNARFVIGGPICWSFDRAGEIDRLGMFDRIVIGDGEAVIGDLVASLVTPGTASEIIRANGRFNIADAKPLYRPLLDSTINRYYGAVLEVSRGCPFLCEFCDTRVLEDNNRAHNLPVDLLIEEIDHFCELGVRTFLLACDNFIGEPRWAEELVDRLLAWKSRTGHKPVFYTWLTINLNKYPGLMRKMRHAGFDTLFIGVESFNSNSLLETAKRPFRKGLSGRCRCGSRKVVETDLEPPCGRRPPESSIAARRCVIRLI